MDFAAFSDDNTVPYDSAIAEWHRFIRKGASIANVNMRMSSTTLKAQFENAGFTNVQVVEKKIPIGHWPSDRKLKEIGVAQLANFLEGLEAFSLEIFCTYLGWSDVEVQVFLAGVRQDVGNRNFHCYWPL